MNHQITETNYQPLVSVIVPVYNVEDYVGHCITSILEQTYKNLEVVLIDDGSTDSSGALCDEYGAEDKRISVIHTQNHGLSAARNRGLKEIRGDYITYVDSDDFLGPNHILNLLSTLLGTGARMAVTGSSVSLANSEKIDPPAVRPSTYELLDAPDAMYTAISSYRLPFAVHAWGKLYDASLAPYLVFPEGKYFEDKFVTYRVMFEAGSIAYEDANDYYYTVFRNSSICGKRDYKFLDTLEAQEQVISFAQEKSLPRIERLVTGKRYGHMIGVFSAACLDEKDDPEQRKLADHLYKMIKKERLAAIQSAATASSTKIAMMLSFLPRPLFAGIAKTSAKKSKEQFEKKSLAEYETIKTAS